MNLDGMRKFYDEFTKIIVDLKKQAAANIDAKKEVEKIAKNDTELLIKLIK